MARTRQVNPIYPFEKEIRSLSISTRYMYLLSWCHMSDPNKKEKIVGGVLPNDEFFIKSNIFPEEDINVKPMIKELLDQHRYFPFEANGKHWFWCPTMPKHQTINHPSKAKYPDPPTTLQEDYCSGKLALPQSRVELSRVENNNKTEPSAGKPVVNNLLKTALDKVFKDGFNIYECLNKLKKESKVGAQVPNEVLLGVCDSYWKNKTKIKKTWPWFAKTIVAEWHAWNAEQNIREGQEYKQDRTMPQSIKEILGVK